MHGNPIRRVVTMLQEMQKSVEKEGETEKELYDKFMCYCETTDGELATSIDQGNTKVSELDSQLQEDTAAKAQMDQDVAQHKSDRTEAEKAMKEATAMRGKEASEFAASSGEMKSNIQAMTAAAAALKKGLSASFLQTQNGAVIRNIVAHTPIIDDTQRDVLMSFLQGGDQMTEGGTDQIIGIVETMLEEMQGDLKEAEESEAAAVATYNGLMQAKMQETSEATKAIETKMARAGELAVAIATGGADLEDSREALDEDTKMKASLKTDCEQKTKEYVERRSNRADEVTALSETIKILNDDDALDLFKKTMPSAPAAPAVFLQTGVSSKRQLHRIEHVLNKLHSMDSAHGANYGLMLLQLKTKHASKNFDHIVKMIDDMVALLKREQADDDKQKEFCDTELRNGANDKAAAEDTIKSIDSKMAELGEVVETTESEIATLKEGIEALDRTVAGATEMRKQQHAEFSSTAAANQAAIELLEMARNRMNKFYNPSMYKAPEPTDAPVYGFTQGAVSFVQVSAHARKQESGGVVQLLSTMIGDVEKDSTAAKMEEDSAQTEYEQTMSEAATKRATDSKLLVTKDAFKAELLSKLDDSKSDRSDQTAILDGLNTKIQDLHSSCDFLLDNYDARKEARTSEIDGLHEGAAVLGSAGFLQRF